MTNHPDDAELLAHLDGELSAGAAERVDRHLEGCRACRRRRAELEGASELLGAALSGLDAPPPRREPEEIRRRAARGDVGGGDRTDDSGAAAAGDRPDAGAPGDGPGAAGPPSQEHPLAFSARRAGRRALLKAAVLVLAVAGAAAAVVPGSPVRDWVVGAVRSLTAPANPAADDSGGAVRAEADGSRAQGVSIPVSERAVVQITDPAPGLRVHVTTTEGPVLSVTGRGARYRAGDGVVEVAGPRGAELRIEIPASVATARVTADGRLLLEKAGDRLQIHVSAVDTGQGGISFPAGGGPGRAGERDGGEARAGETDGGRLRAGEADGPDGPAPADTVP